MRLFYQVIVAGFLREPIILVPLLPFPYAVVFAEKDNVVGEEAEVIRENVMVAIAS